eukprot:713834-Amorphochlora_amoeboformis.AAC.1
MPAAYIEKNTIPFITADQSVMTNTPISWLRNWFPLMIASFWYPYARLILLPVAKIPTAKTPNAPQHPWTGNASKGSSMPRRTRSSDDPM